MQTMCIAILWYLQMLFVFVWIKEINLNLYLILLSFAVVNLEIDTNRVVFIDLLLR